MCISKHGVLEAAEYTRHRYIYISITYDIYFVRSTKYRNVPPTIFARMGSLLLLMMMTATHNAHAGCCGRFQREADAHPVLFISPTEPASACYFRAYCTSCRTELTGTVRIFHVFNCRTALYGNTITKFRSNMYEVLKKKKVLRIRHGTYHSFLLCWFFLAARQRLLVFLFCFRPTVRPHNIRSAISFAPIYDAFIVSPLYYIIHHINDTNLLMFFGLVSPREM